MLGSLLFKCLFIGKESRAIPHCVVWSMVCLTIPELPIQNMVSICHNQLVFIEVHVYLPIGYELVKYGVYHHVY